MRRILAGDIFNLYVWFEVMLIASFGLLVVGGRKDQIDGAVKYVGLNLIATTAMLAGIGLLYGATGSLNMAALHLAVEGNMDQPGILAAASLLLFAFAAKSAMFPLYFWLPAAYHTPSHTTSALFAALLTKVGVYTLIRVFSLVFDVQHPLLQVLLVTSGVATLSLGIFGAMNENHARRFSLSSGIHWGHDPGYCRRHHGGDRGDHFVSNANPHRDGCTLYGRRLCGAWPKN